MTRSRRWWALLGAVVVLVASALAVVATLDTPTRSVRNAPARRGEGLGPAPAVVLEGLRDKDASISVRDFRGRPLVVNFWAAWCAPCRREMPAFQAVYEDLGGQVAFLGIDNRDIRSDGLDLVRETGVRYRLAFDPDGDASRAFGVLAMPTTVFVSPDGEVLERVFGELSEKELRRTIRRLFGVEG